MKGKRRGYGLGGDKPMTDSDLWRECCRSVEFRFDGLDLDKLDSPTIRDVAEHANKFYRIYGYDLAKALDAVHAFIAAHILNNKREFAARLLNIALDVMVENRKGTSCN